MVDSAFWRASYQAVLINTLYFAVGLAALYLGAGWLVGAAARVAYRLGMRPLVVGLTVVAFGSSAPELLVGVVASVGGQSEVLLGNVVGSNILNVALILGISTLVRPLRVGHRLMSREVPLMLGFSVLAVVLMLDRGVTRLDGLLLLGAFTWFIWFVVHRALREPEAAVAEHYRYRPAGPVDASGPMGRDVGVLLLGLTGLAVGAQLLVMSAVFFARTLGVTDVMIGLTVVAIGTSLPELATCVVAARRSEFEIALGNVVGSNVFNLLSILGISAMIRPIPVDPGLLRFELPAMLFFSLLLVPLGWGGRWMGRGSAGVLLGGYVVFMAVLISRALGY